MTAAPRIAQSEEQIIAAVTAGHIMAGMPPTESDLDAVRRVLRGESTAEQEAERIAAEIRASRRA